MQIILRGRKRLGVGILENLSSKFKIRDFFLRADKGSLDGKSECELEFEAPVVPANSNYERIISRRRAGLRSCTLYELLPRLQYGGPDTRGKGNKRK